MKVTRGQRLEISLILSAILYVLCPSANGQQQSKPPARIGWLLYGSAPTGALPSVETAVMQGLRELGYVEGKNIVFEYRFADGQPERLPALAAALVAQKPDAMIAIGGDIAVAVKNGTATIPIIIGTSDDPVRASIISSFARPGRNITGVTFVMDQVAGKRVQLLKEINPKLSTAAVLWNPAHADNELKEIQAAAEEFNVKLSLFKVERMEDFASAFAGMKKQPSDALIVVPSRLTSERRQQLATFALNAHIPMASGWREFAEAGGLLSYGANRAVIARRIAYYVDKVLKGTKPAALPVETPSKFEFVINLKTAKEIGLTVPQSVLYRADSVIQ